MVLEERLESLQNQSSLDLANEMADVEIDESFYNFIKELKKALRDDWDAVTAITGILEGIGKSSLAIIKGYLLDSKFDLIKNISYLPRYSEIEAKFMALDQYQQLDVDEAVKVFHKHKWMDRFQQRLIEMYATERKQNKATDVLMPRIKDFTENFRNHKIHFNIHLVSRGYAVVFIKDDFNYASNDPWHLKETDKLLEKLRMNRKIIQIPLEQRMEYYRKVPNYFFDFIFPPLPTKVFAEYKRIGFALRQTKQIQTFGLESIRLLQEEFYRVWAKGTSIKEIATETRFPESTVGYWIRKIRREKEDQDREKVEIRQ